MNNKLNQIAIMLKSENFSPPRLIPSTDPIPRHPVCSIGKTGSRRSEHLQQLLHAAHRLLQNVLAERQIQ